MFARAISLSWLMVSRKRKLISNMVLSRGAVGTLSLSSNGGGSQASLNMGVLVRVFSRFRVGLRGQKVSHLQYFDDTVLAGEPVVDNLLMIEAIL